MDYLNQITGSVQARHQAGSGSMKLLTPLMIKIIAIGVILFVLLLVVGGMLGGMASKATDIAKQVDVRMTNLMALEETYGKEVKSPKLRSIGTTLRGVMMDTTRDLGAYLTDLDGFNVAKASGGWVDKETATKDELTATLENARLNGLLDETFVREMSLQIALLLSMESEVMERTENGDLKTIMSKSTESLQVIQNNLDNL